MTTKTISDWLSTTIASDLSVTCKLGYPAFDRPDIAAGAYLRFRQSDPIVGERVSATVDRFTRAFDVMVITASEVALLAKIDLMEAMVIARTAATASSPPHTATPSHSANRALNVSDCCEDRRST